jgi:hypothetical protein
LRQQVLQALVDVRATLEADVGGLTLANVQGWRNSIDQVAAASTLAAFKTAWAIYEKKHALLLIELIRLLVR